jgi:hypothetical protein
MPHNQWVAFDDSKSVHECGNGYVLEPNSYSSSSNAKSINAKTQGKHETITSRKVVSEDEKRIEVPTLTKIDGIINTWWIWIAILLFLYLFTKK